MVSAYATTIHKFQGFEAGFDENDQFRHLIIDPGDIKSEQQQPGLLYVATSRVKTIGDMTHDVPHPKNSALYWTGSGMSINRVLNGTTKKQLNTQGQERVNCLNGTTFSPDISTWQSTLHTQTYVWVQELQSQRLTSSHNLDYLTEP